MWASGVRHSLRSLLHDLDLLFRQAVEFVDELVDLFVRRSDLALDERFLVIGLGDYVGLQGQSSFFPSGLTFGKKGVVPPRFPVGLVRRSL